MKVTLGAMALCLAVSAIPAEAANTNNEYQYELRANRQVSETAQMVMGCFAGAAAGAVVGGFPIVSGWGTSVTPYTVPYAIYIGCLAGTSIGSVSAKVYNYLVLRYW